MTVTTPAETGPPATTKASADQLGWALVVGLVVVRLLLSWHSIRLPGLQQDETLFVDAATSRIPGPYLVHSIHSIPVMVFPYIGALKSWLYAPLFSLFGESATVIRLPAVLITSAGLLLVYPAVRDTVNRPVALLSVTALCFDNSIFWLTRDDVGPSAIEFALKCSLLFCAARLWRNRHKRWLLLLLLTLALGVFNKLNFIWIVNGCAVVSTVLALCHWRSFREHWRLAAVWVSGLALIYASFAYYYFHYHISSILAGSGTSLTQPWFGFEQGISGILSGTWFYGYALAPLGPRMFVVWLVLTMFVCGALASTLAPRVRSFPVAATALMTVLIALQNLITRQATAGWHYVAIYPFVTIVAAYGVFAVARLAFARTTHIQIVIACSALIALSYDGLLMVKYFQALPHEPTNAAWSPAIYSLSRDLERTKGTIFTADWGIFNPLFALHPGTRYRELGFALASPSPPVLAGVAGTVAATPGPKLIVTHVNSTVQFPDANVDLFRAMAAHLQLLRIVSGPDHDPVFAIYAYH